MKKSSGGKFRSTDLQVMGLPRFHCATPLSGMRSVIGYISSQNENVSEKKKKREFQRRESNPGLKRERLECYRLHHIGFYLVMEDQVV